MAKLRVFRGHQLVGEFDADRHHFAADAEHRLRVVEFSADGRPPAVVKTYRPGEWHSAGVELVCGYGPGQAGDDCDRCPPHTRA